MFEPSGSNRHKENLAIESHTKKYRRSVHKYAIQKTAPAIQFCSINGVN